MSSSASRQHPIKRDAGMIDADAVEEAPSFLGVCDGVSEVQKLGISPDELPRELLQRIREGVEEREGRINNGQVDRQYSGGQDGAWLIDTIQESYLQTESLGSTTLLLAVIEDSNRLLIANLGDSCGLLLRRDQSQPRKFRIIYKTEPLRFDH